MSKFEPAIISDGKTVIEGKTYMGDGRGGLRPIEMIKPQDLLQDETCRKIIGHWMAISEQIARFKGHVIDDIDDFMQLLAQEYGVTKFGGKKGNKTIQTVDSLFKVEVRINDYVDFGPELQVAKELVDECLNTWSDDAQPEIRALVKEVFNTEKEGQVNRQLLNVLTKIPSEDDRWLRAMKAIQDAQRVIGSKTYIRAAMRDAYDAAWSYITIDMAKA